MNAPDKVNDGLSVFQNKNGLTLTTDAYLLSAFVPKNAKKSVCELCAGTGVVSLLLLQRGKCSEAVCVDFQAELCELARKNAEYNGQDGVMFTVCSDVKDYRPNRRFDRVVCNPPYLKRNTGKSAEHTERLLSLHESTADINDICAAAGRILKTGGEAFFCYIPERTADLYCAMRAAGIEPKTQLLIYPTLTRRPSLLLASGGKGCKSGMKTFPPVFIYADKESGEYTIQMENIYKNNSFEI